MRIDNKPAAVESVTWIPESALAREMAGIDNPLPEVNTSADVPPPRGRLFVFFYQTDIAREYVRVVGQMQINQYIDKLMDIASNDPDRDLRKQAIFWLGQSRDPRVQKFLLDLINR